MVGVPKEVNIITCEDQTSGQIIGQGNVDINVVACAIHVTVDASRGIVQQQHWTIRPSFWHFFLESGIIEPLTDTTPAQTAVRVAYKAWELELAFSLDFNGTGATLGFLSGVLFSSHKAKALQLQQQEDWKHKIPFPPA
jgi:hypothetical protein